MKVTHVSSTCPTDIDAVDVHLTSEHLDVLRRLSIGLYDSGIPKGMKRKDGRLLRDAFEVINDARWAHRASPERSHLR